MIEISRDYEGLRQAALELLEESRTSVRRERTAAALEQAAPPFTLAGEELLTRMAPQRKLAAGYYDRVAYLMELDGVPANRSGAPLEVTELHGLAAVARARDEFAAAHPACPGCGQPRETQFQNFCECGWRRDDRAAAPANMKGRPGGAVEIERV